MSSSRGRCVLSGMSWGGAGLGVREWDLVVNLKRESSANGCFHKAKPIVRSGRPSKGVLRYVVDLHSTRDRNRKIQGNKRKRREGGSERTQR